MSENPAKYDVAITGKKGAVTFVRIGSIAVPVTVIAQWVGPWLLGHVPALGTEANAVVVAGAVLGVVGSVVGAGVRMVQNWMKHKDVAA